MKFHQTSVFLTKKLQKSEMLAEIYQSMYKQPIFIINFWLAFLFQFLKQWWVRKRKSKSESSRKAIKIAISPLPFSTQKTVAPYDESALMCSKSISFCLRLSISYIKLWQDSVFQAKKCPPECRRPCRGECYITASMRKKELMLEFNSFSSSNFLSRLVLQVISVPFVI